MKHTFVTLLAVLFFLSVSQSAQAADANAFAALQAAGAKVSTIKGGGTRVDIAADKITDDVWKQLGSLGDLKAFSCSGKEFDDASLARLAKITTIETLFFNGPSITDQGLAALANFPNLQKYGTDHGQMTGSGLAALAGAKGPQALSFGGCLFNDQGMEAVGRLIQLRELSIRHDRNTSASFANFGKLTDLEKLGINPNFSPYYTGADFVHLESLKNLQELTIAQMVIPYDNGLSHLKLLGKLKKLKLESCGISDADLAKLKADLPTLAIDFTPAPEASVKKWDEALAKKRK